MTPSLQTMSHTVLTEQTRELRSGSSCRAESSAAERQRYRSDAVRSGSNREAYAIAARARILGITDKPWSLSKRRFIDCEQGPQSQKCSSFNGGLRLAIRKGLLVPFGVASLSWYSGGVISTSTRKIFPSRK